MTGGLVSDLAVKQARKGPMRRLERVVLHKHFGLDGVVSAAGGR